MRHGTLAVAAGLIAAATLTGCSAAQAAAPVTKPVTEQHLTTVVSPTPTLTPRSSDTVNERSPIVATITACATEDSSDCYWDAASRGNGHGTSFVDIDGRLFSATGHVTMPEGVVALPECVVDDSLNDGCAYLRDHDNAFVMIDGVTFLPKDGE